MLNKLIIKNMDNSIINRLLATQVFLTGSNPLTGIFTGSLSAVTSYLLVN
jgi:hypothetical protein